MSDGPLTTNERGADAALLSGLNRRQLKELEEKQKEGKKKMRSLGTVQVPTEACMAVLRRAVD